MRSRKPRRPSPITFGQRLVCLSVIVAPPLVLGVRLTGGLLNYLDKILAQSAPLVSAVASSSLGREVRVGKITPFLSTAEIWKYYRRLPTLGSLPVEASDITIANGPNLATSGELAYARRVTASVSVPALLSGRANAAVTSINVESPRLYLLRRKNGTFNVQELVKKKPGPPGPPFLTTITLMDAAVRFVDQATKYPAAQQLDAYPVSGTAVLGARSLRFDARVMPKSGTWTARRLAGPILASGALAQGQPGTRPDAARATDPQYTLRLSIPEADAPYFVRYAAGAIPNVTLAQGRVRDAQVTLIGPTVAEAIQATNTKKKAPSPSVSAVANAVGFRVGVKGLPTPIEDLSGPVRYNSNANLVSFDATALAFGERVGVNGSVWDFAKSPSTNGPRIAVQFAAPRIPLGRVLPAFKAKLPANVSLGGLASATGFLAGTPNDLTGTAHLTVPRVSVRGQATLENINADVAYAGGTLDVPRLTAQTDLGGPVVASGRAHFARVGANGRSFQILPANQITATFAAQAQRVSLARVADLAKAAPTARKLQLSGTGSVATTGSVTGGRVSLTADVATQGLSVAGLPFSVAQARVVVRDNVITVPSGRFVSPVVGSVAITGNTSLLTAGRSGSTPLAIQFAAHALDAGRLARAFGVAGVGGVVDAVGSVGGTLSSPRLTVQRLAVLNPRYRQYVAQSLTGANIVADKQGVTIPASAPLTLRRFPAAVQASGHIGNLFPSPGQAKARPTLALNARVTNLDYSTVQPLLAKAGVQVKPPVIVPINTAQPATDPTPPSDTPLPPGSVRAQTASTAAPGFSGTLTEATARITGYADNPTVVARGEVQRLILGTYPIDTGTFRVSYQNGRITIPEVNLTANAGTVTAQATVERSGEVVGSFQAPKLDLARLSYLTEGAVSLSGLLNISGTFSGTRERPVVTVNIAPSDIRVAGTAINNLTATNVKYIANLQSNVQRVEIPRISLAQGGDTSLVVENGGYDFRTKQFGGTLTARSKSVAELVGAVRRSAFARSRSGRVLLDKLEQLPSPLDAALPAERPGATPGSTVPTNRLVVKGRVGDQDLNELRVSGDLYVTNVQVGPYTADRIALSGLITGNPPTGTRNGGKTLPLVDRLNGDIQLTGANLRAGDYVADTINFSGQLAQSTLTVRTGTIVSKESTINASGSVGFGENGTINALVESNNLSLDLVRAFSPTFPVNGNVAVVISATGPTRTPNVQASIDGSNLLVVQRDASGQVLAPKEGDAPVQHRINLVRAIARVDVDKKAKARANGDPQRFVELSDGQMQIDGVRLELEGRVPFAYTAPVIPADEPLRLRLRLPSQTVSSISALGGFQPTDATNPAAKPDPKTAKSKPSDPVGIVGGTAEGTVTLTGTLKKPNLAGLISVTGGQYRFAKVNGRVPFNAINNLDATISLVGTSVTLDSILTLGAPSGKGDRGTLTLTGGAKISELQTALNTLSGTKSATGEAPPLGSGTQINLLAKFDKLAIEENSLLEQKTKLPDRVQTKRLNEAVRVTIDGSITAKGPLNAPRIATPEGSPLLLSNVRITPPSGGDNEQTTETSYPINPEFALQISSPQRATLALGGSLLTVDVTGDLSIAGSLKEPNVNGQFITQGGVLNYYLRRFTVDKNGVAEFVYRNGDGYINLSDINARTTVYLAPGTTIAGETNTRGGLPIGYSVPSADGRGTRYKIQASINGRVRFNDNDPTADPNAVKKELVTLESDPPLSPNQIYSLLLPQSQLQQVAGGNVSQALQEGFNQAINNSLLPGLVSPLQDRLAGAFGLEQLSVDYSPSAPLSINLLKRLPEPLDRFVITYSRTLQNSGLQAGQPVPYNIGLLFELYELGQRQKGPQPHIQFGVSTNEQRDLSSYLRATILY